MDVTRRRVLVGSVGSLGSLLGCSGFWWSRSARAADAPVSLKISHQFPSSSGAEGDFRDRLVRKFAAEIEKRSGGKLKCEIYPGSSLMKVNAQFAALRKGAWTCTVCSRASM